MCSGTVLLLLSGHLGSGKTAIARGIVRFWCRDPAMFVPRLMLLLKLTYQENTAPASLPAFLLPL